MVLSRRLLALALVSLVAGGSLAQEGIPNSSKKDLADLFDVKKRDQFSKLITGQEPHSKKDDLVLDIGAKYYAWRLQWPIDKDEPAILAKHVHDLEVNIIGVLLSPTNSKNTKSKMVFAKALAGRLKDVLDLDFDNFRPSIMFAAQSLPLLAKLKSDDVDKMLTSLVDDGKRHETVKLWAIKSMKEYFPARQVTNEDDLKEIEPKKVRDLKRVALLIQYIEAKRPTPADAGELDAIRYLRREAIHTLAQAQVPAVAALKKVGQAEGVVAATLMRVLIKDGVTPPPALAEKCEAALGLCHLKCANLPNYYPDMGVYLVGQFLDEYVREYASDYLNLKGPPLKKKIPVIAWKFHSERLRLGLEDLEKNTKGTTAQDAAVKLAGAGKSYLGTLKEYGRLDNPSGLRPMVQGLRPKNTALFKDVKGPEIKLPN